MVVYHTQVVGLSAYGRAERSVSVLWLLLLGWNFIVYFILAQNDLVWLPAWLF